MNSQKPPAEHDSRLIDALLHSALRPESENEQQRVDNVVAAIRDESQPRPAESLPSGNRRWSWLAWPTVAAAMLAGYFLLFSETSPNQAMAAVERGLLAEQKPLSREYEIEIVSRTALGRTRTDHVTLFVKQDAFAIRTRPLLGPGEVWLGGHGQQRWIVPRLGPVIVGREGLLRPWIRRRKVVETPFLMVSAMLQRLRRSYRLELQPPTQIEGVSCDHVVALRREDADPKLPDRVELWGDRKQGFAQRIAVHWERADGAPGYLHATARLIGTPDLPENFFHHQAHHAEKRRVIEQP